MQHQHIPLALAIAAALLGANASAQDVTVYGKFYPFLVTESTSGSTAVGTPVSSLSGTPNGLSATSGTKGMAAGNSRIGIRGKEALGGGLTARYQLEGTVAVDTGLGGTWNRDTFVGLDSDALGSIKLGNLDTVFKNYGDVLGMLGASSGTFLSTSDVLRKTGFGTSSASSFHLRRANAISVESREFGGFEAGFQVSTNEGVPAGRNPKVYSMGLKYEKGPIYVALAHEIHKDLFGGSFNAPAAQRNSADLAVGSRDSATQLALVYSLGKQHRFEFDVIQKQYKENPTVTGRFQSYRNTAYMLVMENNWGLWRTSAHYVKADAGSCARVATACNTNGLAASKFAVGAAYSFSKRTYVFSALSRITNGPSARYYRFETSDTVRANPGEDINHLALGLAHSF